MRGTIPKNPAWCSHCIAGGKPCSDHRGSNGEPVEYAGSEVYEPSEWVLEVIGHRYNGLGGIYRCFGYDPREGFWMETVGPHEGEPDYRRTNVSERAIGRTYHRVHMKLGSYRLLQLFEKLGRAPRADEAEHIVLDLATKTLLDLGCINSEGMTEIGRSALGTRRACPVLRPIGVRDDPHLGVGGPSEKK